MPGYMAAILIEGSNAHFSERLHSLADVLNFLFYTFAIFGALAVWDLVRRRKVERRSMTGATKTG